MSGIMGEARQSINQYVTASISFTIREEKPEPGPGVLPGSESFGRRPKSALPAEGLARENLFPAASTGLPRASNALPSRPLGVWLSRREPIRPGLAAGNHKRRNVAGIGTRFKAARLNGGRDSVGTNARHDRSPLPARLAQGKGGWRRGQFPRLSARATGRTPPH